MAATYPNGIKSFTVFEDYNDVDAAANINEIHDEIVAMQQALGPNVATLNATSHVAGTVGSILDQFSSNIQTLLQRTANPYASWLGGPNTGQYIQATANTLQANDGTKAMRMVLQSNGGDVVVGNAAGINFSIFGKLSTTKGISTPGQLSAGNTSVNGALNVSGEALFYGGLVAEGQTITIADVTATDTVSASTLKGGKFDFGNGVTVFPITNPYGNTQYGAVQYNADVTFGAHVFQGHVTISAWRQSDVIRTETGVVTAPLLIERPHDTNSEIAFFSDATPGVFPDESFQGGALALWLINFDVATNGGFTAATGSNSTGEFAYLPVTASAFNVWSTREGKLNIEDLPHGLATLRKLRPVHFHRPAPDLFAPKKRQKDGTFAFTTHREREAARERLQPQLSPADKKRIDTRHLGLVAEEVYEVLPEVCSLNAKGQPAGIDYGGLVPLLISAVQELGRKVERLEAQQGPIA